MSAIDNTNLLNVFGGQTNVIGFTPAASYTYNSSTGAIVVTDATALPSGDTLAGYNVQVFDKFGGEIRDNITALAGNTGTIDASTLDRTKPLDIKVTIVTAQNRVADGGAYNIGAAGPIKHWDKQKNVTS